MLPEKLWLLPDRNFNIVSINNYLSYSKKEMPSLASPFFVAGRPFFCFKSLSEFPDKKAIKAVFMEMITGHLTSENTKMT